MFAVSGFFAGIGPMEIIVILVIALVLFGSRLPEVAKTLGKGYMEFRRGLKNLENSIDFDAETPGDKRAREEPKALLPGGPERTPETAQPAEQPREREPDGHESTDGRG